MTFQAKRINELGQLSQICKDNISTSTSIGILSHQTRKSPIFEIFLVFIEYFHLLSQALLTNSGFISLRAPSSNNLLCMGASFLAKLVNPAYWFSFTTGNELTEGVLIAVMIYTVLKLLLFGYITFIAVTKKAQPHFIIREIWRWTFKIQGRMMCFIVTSFWVRTIMEALENSSDIFFNIGKMGTLVLFVFLIIIEYIFSFYLEMHYRIIVPTKSLLSSKSYHTETITLTQKLVIQAIQVIFSAYSLENNIVFPLVSLAFCMVRNLHYFRTLPLYNFKVLVYQAILLVLVTCLAFSCLFQVITQSMDYQDELQFVLITWIILTLLAAIIAYGYLNQIRLDLLSSTSKASTNLLVHKIILIKQLRNDKTLPGGFNAKNSYCYLMNEAVGTSLASVFDLDAKSSQDKNLTMNIKETSNKMFAGYLEGLLARFPKSNCVKLYTALFYAKKLKLYGTAMKLLTELQHSHDHLVSLNASILIDHIQNIITSHPTTQDNEINLHLFFQTQMRSTEIKKKMHKQSQMQIHLYEELLSDMPDLNKIFTLGQLIAGQKVQIERESNQMLADMPDYYIQPLMLYAHYHSILNHSMPNYTKYSKQYKQKYLKYEKSFRNEHLTSENFYQDCTAFALVSGQKENFGKIIFCTNSVGRIYGGDANLYIGGELSSLAPLSSQNLYSLFFETKSEEEQKKLRNRAFRGMSYHREGHLLELDFHLDVFPFLTQGFYFSLVIRPTHTAQEYLVIRENGDIEGVTKHLGLQLGFNKQRSPANHNPTLNVKQISEELRIINKVFNSVLHSEHSNSIESNEKINPIQRTKKKANSMIKYLSVNSITKLDQRLLQEEEEELDPEVVNKLYEDFSNGGENIRLTPFNSNEKAFSYSCRVKILSQKTEIMKLVILEENKRGAMTSKVFPSRLLTNKFSKDNELEDNIPAEGSEIATTSKYSRKKNASSIKMEKLDISLDSQDGNVPNEFVAEDGTRKHYNQPAYFSGREHFVKAVLDADTASEGNLFSLQSPTSNAGLPLIQSAEPTMSKFKMNFQRHQSFKIASNTTQSENQLEDEADQLGKLYEASVHSASSVYSQKKALTRAFNLALTIKYYSKTPKFLFLFCFMMLLGVLVGQIVVKINLDSVTQDLKTKKDLLRSSQQRDFALVGVHRAMRTVWDLGTGRYTSIKVGTYTFTINTYISSVNTSLTSLSDNNQQIMVNSGVVDEDTRQQLYLKDVKIYFTDFQAGKRTQLTNFQAANSIAESGFKAIVGSKKSNVTNYQTEFDFIFRNAVNDLLIKTESVSDLLLTTIQNTIKSKRLFLDYFLGIRVVMLLTVCFSLCWIIIKLYVKEKTDMYALVRLDKKGLEETLERFKKFKASLETGNNFSDKLHIKLLTKTTTFNRSVKQNAKKQSKTPNHNGILRRYMFILITSLLCVLAFIGFTVGVSVAASNTIEGLRSKQSRLYFADTMATRTNYAFLASQEVFASNDTSITKDQEVLLQLNASVEDMDTLVITVMDSFADPDMTYDTLVETVLFDDGCKLLNSSSTPYCNIIKNKSQQTNLVSLLSYYYTLIKQKYQDFLSSNRTTASLNYLQLVNYDQLLCVQRILGEQSTLIANRFNTLFEASFTNLASQGSITLGVFVVIATIFSYLMWVYVFKKLRESINQFKNILQVFPSNLILSNFILKTFLIKTSMGILDSRKHDL